ncbi:MAG: glycosyltransferase family 39 protein [Flavobacteriales bacterium]|nr:glycosyltransferase family 39 protein [Flavobacteriales bacterium]
MLPAAWSTRIRDPRYAQVIALVALWLIATTINLTKSFHVDDPFHLAVAQWILEEPLKPMSGMINWGGVEEPFHHGNHPPLFFYGMAAWGAVLGFSEVSMHALLSLFTALALVMFHRLARLFAPRVALFATALLALSPGFIVNQNVFLDIPLLSLILGSLYHACCASMRKEGNHAVYSALFLSAAILTKYTALAVVPAWLVMGWFAGRRTGWTVLIPVAVIGLWSFWNVREFGYVHLFHRDTGPPGADSLGIRALSWTLTLGSIAPGLFLLFVYRIRMSAVRRKAVAIGLLSVLVLFVVGAWTRLWHPEVTESALMAFFIVNGILGLGALIGPSDLPREPRAILRIALGSIAVFTMLYAPWIATRHLVLALPLVLLLTLHLLDRMSRPVRGGLIVVSGAIGIALGISDRHFAGFYAEQAAALSTVDRGHTTWYAGSFGWGWYAKAAGLRDIAEADSLPKAGDLIVVPMDFSSPSIPEAVHTREVMILQQALGPLDAFSTRHWLRFYCARYPDPPWHLSHAEPERLMVLVVD